MDKLKSKLTPMQYHVTQEEGTEPPFNNEFWNFFEEGIYVDVVSGEPLFSSKDKFYSSCGWPAFSKPINPEVLKQKPDYHIGYLRIEVRSLKADSHLGHVFDDGPTSEGTRYCINSASMRFIAKQDLIKEGYADYLSLFE